MLLKGRWTISSTSCKRHISCYLGRSGCLGRFQYRFGGKSQEEIGWRPSQGDSADSQGGKPPEEAVEISGAEEDWRLRSLVVQSDVQIFERERSDGHGRLSTC